MSEQSPYKMKPVIILPPETMSKEDIERLMENGMCVVVAKEPALVKFMDPIPAVAGRSIVEQAAIDLSRKILAPGFWQSDDTRKTIATTYYDLLIRGTPLDPKLAQKKEMEQRIFDDEKQNELRRLAKEEAKAERDAVKAEKAAAAAAAKKQGK